MDGSTPSTTRAARTRSPNWTVLEDEQLAISWVTVSENTIQSNNQSGAIFYGKVAEHYNEAAKNHNWIERTDKQVQNHWKPLNTATLKFSAIYWPIVRNPPSGSAPSDFMGIAKKEYFNQTKEVFEDEVAWQVLHRHPKWAQPIDPLKKSSVNTSVSSSISSPIISTRSSPPPPSSDPFERPIGQKKAKRQRQEADLDTERTEELKRASDIQERKLAVLEQGHKLADRALQIDAEAKRSHAYYEDMKVLTTSPDLCPDEESKAVLKLMKSRLLKKYSNDEEGQADD